MSYSCPYERSLDSLCFWPLQLAKAGAVCCAADAVIGISCAVLVLLYFFQRLGTSKLGHFFAPMILLWFFSNFCIGIYNIVTWRPGMFRISP